MYLARIFCLPLLLVAPLALAANGGNHARSTRTFARNVPTAGLTGVSLNVAVGDIHVSTAHIPVIRVQATAEPGNHGHFIFDWTTGPSAGPALPAGLRLVTARRGSLLVICLASSKTRGCNSGTGAPSAGTGNAGAEHIRVMVGMPSGMHVDFGNDDHAGWKANWTLTLPAQLALELRDGVGDATIAGVAGGLQAKLGVGDVNASLPRGPLNATVGVGDVKAAIASADYGEIALASGVGHITFTVNGHKQTAGYEHQFAAASQHLTGPGRTAYALKTGVGDIELHLGAQGASGTTDEAHQKRTANTIGQQ